MTAAKRPKPPAKMNFDQFMAWYEQQEGRWELHDGIPVRRHDPAKGQSERAGHARVKNHVLRALEKALDKAGSECEAMPDGMTVKIDNEISYELNNQPSPRKVFICIGDSITHGKVGVNYINLLKDKINNDNLIFLNDRYLLHENM